MLRKVLLGLVLLLGAFVGFVALQPAAYSVARSRVIPAPRPVVFALLADLSRFDEWSPWAELDHDMDKTITGDPGQVGTMYRWKGKQSGEGSLEITAVEANRRIEQKLVFIAPVAGEAATTYALSDAEGGTKVTWTMAGEQDFLGKIMGLVFDFEAMIGADYEKGLAKLEQVAQADAADPAFERPGATPRGPTGTGDGDTETSEEEKSDETVRD